jgi:hypothetical protein
MTTYIQLGNLGNLELKSDETISLNYKISEIQDISKRAGGFSKTIKIIGNANNNQLLAHLFDVNVADASFNINIKQKCNLIQNGISVFDGYLQLLNVTRNTQSLGTPDEFVEYDVQLKDDTGNFYSSMQEKLLQDLPLFNQYNHIYTLSAITATSAHTVNDAYTYILPFNANTNYKITDFSPAIYAKAYWDRIFYQAGYTYQWDSLQACSFDKLIVPYNGDSPLVNNSLYNFRAGFETGATVSFISSAVTITTAFGFSTVVEPLSFDDEVTPPNFDNGNHYDPLTSTYTSTIISDAEFKLRYKYEVTLNVPVNCYLTNVFGDSSLNLRLTNITRIDGVTDYNAAFFGPKIFGAPNGQNIPFTAGTSIIINDIANTSALFAMNVGQDVKPYIRADFSYNGIWYNSGTTSPLTQAEIPYFTVTRRIDATDYDNNYFSNNLTGILNEGQLVEVDKLIPKQIKQRDFINGIVKMFNLYITPDKYEENHLIIQTRDEFYDSGNIIDWTQKFALDDSSGIEFLPDLQDKRLILTYKQDSDEWNKQYQLATGEIYGQVQYEFISEFTQSTKKIENIFSPTPIIPNTNGLLVPAIVAKAPKTNIRILFYDGWKAGQWKYDDTAITLGATKTFETYPRALHLNDPITPSIDINYGEPDYFGYSNYQSVTYNNLYNAYWSRFINQIETGKLLSGTFLLTEVDIHNLDLRSKVWLHDAYYNINSIEYNPNGNGLTKVELISVDEGLQFAPFSIDKNSTGNTVTDVGPKNNWITNFVSVQGGTNGNIYGTTVVNTQVLGNDNIVQGGSQSSIIVGNNNNYFGKFGFVSGEENNVQGDNIYVFGGSGLTVTGDSQALFNVPVVATTISADTLFIGGSPTPIEPSPFIAGSAGLNNAVQFGSLADATGDYSFASGQDTIASGFGSNASNIGTSATGLGSHAEGFNTVASANYTHAEGEGTVAQGQNSHAQGKGSNAVGFYSHAGGNYSRASYDGEISSNGIASSTVGRTQFGILNSIGFTTNATPTLLDFDNGAIAQNGFTPPFAVVSANDLAMSFTYQIVCFRASNGTARIITGEGLIKWITGVPTLVYASTPSVNGDIGLLGVTATPVASGFGLQFQITGIAASNLRWTLRMDYNW